MGSVIVGLIILVVAVALYFLPTIIANSRLHQNTSGIFVLNLLIGWTFIGWVIALVMACGEIKDTGRPRETILLRCSACQRFVTDDDKFCPQCGANFEGKSRYSRLR